MLNYTYIANIENEHTFQDYKVWMEIYWDRSFYLAAAYVLFVLSGTLIMKARPPFKLHNILLAWNIFLSAFSIVGTVRFVPAIISHLYSNGFHDNVCNPMPILNSQVSFWAWLFVLSKVFEMGDTVLLILRKKHLMFLHWYHHAIVLLYSWYTWVNFNANAMWFIMMNFVAHSLMYTYYSFKTLRFPVSENVSMLITTYQLLQMFMGTFISLYTCSALWRGQRCMANAKNIIAAFLMYSSFLVLFSNFFIKRYVLTPKPAKKIN